MFDMWSNFYAMGSPPFYALLISGKCFTDNWFFHHAEILWETFGKMRTDVTDDQIKMNLALEALHIKWTHDSSLPKQSIAYEGIGSHEIKVTLLPPKVACRHWACQLDKKDQYYIWHRGSLSHTMDPKTSLAKSDGVWYLREDWTAITNQSSLTGRNWLTLISNLHTSC